MKRTTYDRFFYQGTRILSLKLSLTNLFSWSCLFLFSALAAESELKKYGQFVEDYTERLKQGLKHNKVLKLDAQILPNVKKDNPLRMVSSPYEGISLPNLVLGCTDNPMLGKVILALSAICSEMEFLVSDEELRIKFLDPLLLYGTEIAGKKIKRFLGSHINYIWNTVNAD